MVLFTQTFEFLEGACCAAHVRLKFGASKGLPVRLKSKR
jgi:hypothetical protein